MGECQHGYVLQGACVRTWPQGHVEAVTRSSLSVLQMVATSIKPLSHIRLSMWLMKFSAMIRLPKILISAGFLGVCLSMEGGEG